MFLSLLFFITGLLGFLTFTVIVAQYKSNRKVNFYLLILIFFASFRFLFFAIHTLIPFLLDEELVIVFRSFGSAIFPCLYLYFKSLVANKKNVVKEDLFHFVFPILFGFTNLLIHNYFSSLQLYSYFLFSGIPLFYLFLSYVELKNKVWFRKSKVSVVENQRMHIRNWASFFFVVSVLFILRLVASLFIDIYVAGYSNGTGYFWVAAIICCILFFKILLTPDVLFISHVLGDKEKTKEYFELVFDDFWMSSNEVLINNSHDFWLKERVENNLMAYIHEIEKMALEHFCFRNPSVSLRDFAIKLGIPKSHLIYFFKYHSNVNFIEFKKTVRVYDSISLIEEGYLKFNTVDSLSKKTGFSCCELFLISFKEITGIPPLEYNKMIKEV